MKSLPKRILIFLCFVLLLAAAFFVHKMIYGVRIPEINDDMPNLSRRVALGALIDAASNKVRDKKNFSIDVESSQKEIDAARLMGAGFVRFDVERRTLQSEGELKKLDRLVAYARAAQLHIELAYWGADQWYGGTNKIYGGGGRADWDQFRKDYAADADSLVRRYKSDYFLILPDCPDVIGGEVSSEQPSSDWLSFAKQVALSLKHDSPQTKIVLEETFLADGNARGELDFAETVIMNNDPVFDVMAMKARGAEQLDGGIKNLTRLRDKYHWQGEVWLSGVEFTDDSFSLVSDKEARRKDFYLYAAFLAGANNVSALSVSGLRGDAGGLLRKDFSPTPAYGALEKVLGTGS